PGDDPRFADLAQRRVRRANDLLALAVRDPAGLGTGADMRRALVDRLLERYGSEASPAVRERFAWLIHPADLPALPDAQGGAANDPGAQARRDAEREFA